MDIKHCAKRKLIAKYADLAKFLRVIGDDNRLRILCFLKEGEKCVCDIHPPLGMAQNLASSHLKILHDLNLINVRQDWKMHYYSINRKTFKKYGSLLNNLLKKY